MNGTVKQVCAAIVRAKLLTEDDVRARYARWKQVSQSDAADTEKFLRWMVAERALSSPQAQALARNAGLLNEDLSKAETVKTPIVSSTNVAPNEAAREWELEIVPPPRVAIRLGNWRLTMRDVLMIGIGAASVAAVAAMGFLVARM
jgi:hypothetical protein